VKGIDVSSNQHPANQPIDWEKVADAGWGFAIVKATQGTSYTNPWLARDLDDARAAGLFVGAYHFYETGPSPESQAEYFVAACMGQVLDLGAWLDWEPPAMQQWEISSAYNGFMETAHKARPGCGVYCDEPWLTELKGAMVTPSRLWVASWGGEQPKGCLLWQDATNQTVPGVPAEVDTDVMVNARAFNLPSQPA